MPKELDSLGINDKYIINLSPYTFSYFIIIEIKSSLFEPQVNCDIYHGYIIM